MMENRPLAQGELLWTSDPVYERLTPEARKECRKLLGQLLASVLMAQKAARKEARRHEK